MGRRLRDVGAGAVTAAVVFGAVPAVMVAFVGVPLPDHFDRSAVLSTGGLFDGLAVVAWVAWAACVLPLLRSVVGHVHRGDTSAPAGARLTERLAVRMATAVLALAPVGTATATTVGAATRPPATVEVPAAAPGPPETVPPAAPLAAIRPSAGPAPPGSVPAPAPGAAPAPPGSAPGSVPASAPATGPARSLPAPPDHPPAAAKAGAWGSVAPTARPVATRTVEAGDSLWSIAERTYGAGVDWPVIARANLGRVMVDGARFVDPSMIRPGWVLDLPPLDGTMPSVVGAPPVDLATVATGPAGPVEHARATGTSVPTSSAEPPGSAGAPTSARATTSAPPPTSPTTGGGAPTVAGRAGALPRPPRADAAPSRPPRPSPAPPEVPFPTLAAFGFGALTAALVARRTRQARRLRALLRPEGAPSPAPSEAAAEVGTAVGNFADLPLVEWIELADRHLAAMCDSARPFDAEQAVGLVRAGADGVEVRLRRPVGWVPPGWERSGPASWRLPARTDLGVLAREAADRGPLLPLLAPVGEDDRGTWLLALPTGCRVCVLGPEADALVSTMRLGAASWEWRDDVLVTSDPGLVPWSPAAGGAGETGPGRSVLFVGDPADLPPGARCAVLTTRPLPDADVVIVVDRRVAALHPLGASVRPHLLAPADERALADLLSVDNGSGAAGPGDPDPSGDPTPSGGAGGRGAGTTAPPALAATPGAGRCPELAPGPVEVRLLVASPRIDGLVGGLPPNRARRAVELVAYLALHHPEPVTGDRLRTRVLGSEDTDAAAKTLFNVAGAARRALGTDGAGHPLLPPATRTGQYRLSPAVTVDVTRAAALVRAGLGAPDPAASSALLQQALALVEADPLSGVLAGYSWWRAEGHERRVTDLLVDGAGSLARAAVAAGDVDLARWAIERARLVEPFSEALARVAMEVAAAAGDATRLHREWQDCLRMVDEVDPGGFPSEETERLYGELRRRVPAGTAGATAGSSDAGRPAGGLR